MLQRVLLALYLCLSFRFGWRWGLNNDISSWHGIA